MRPLASGWRSRATRLVLLLTFFAVPAGLALDLHAAGRGADGRFDQRRSSHFVLYQDVDIDRRSGWSGSIRFEREVLGALETAYDRLDRFLGLRPERPIKVVVYDPLVFHREFASWFRFSAAGFYHGTIRVRGAAQVTASLVHVLHHELVHAALDQAAPSQPLPVWLNEGLAEWFAHRAQGKRGLARGELAFLRHAAAQGALHPLARLSGTHLGAIAGDGARVAYLQSYALVAYLADRSGERALRELCTKIARSRALDRAFEQAFRLELEELEDAFRRDVLGRVAP